MRQQPDLAVISRDRGEEYASAAREGTPQAIQCADRFRIVKNLTEAVQVLLARCQASAPLKKAYDLLQDFLSMVHQREGPRLDAWLARVAESGLPELQSFAAGVEKDKDAV